MFEADQADAVYFFCAGFKLGGKIGSFFLGDCLKLLLCIGILFNEFADSGGEVGDVVEEALYGLKHLYEAVQLVFGGFGSYGLDPADACCNGAFGHDLEHADCAGRPGVGSAAEFDRVAEAYYTDDVSVFLSEQCHCAHCACFLDAGVAFFAERLIGTDEGVHAMLYLEEFLVGDFLEVGEVKAEVVRTYE